jgi:cysteine desulfurase
MPTLVAPAQEGPTKREPGSEDLVREVYFDHAATTAVDPDVLQAMLPYLGEEYGNPSEVHRLGRRARAAVDGARAKVAAALGADEGEIVFTGGGSEADTLALVGFAQALEPGHLIISAVEHPAVTEAARFLQKRAGWQITMAPVDGGGRVDVDAFAAAFQPDTKIASVMLANNVVGTLQPIAELASIAHEHGAKFHTDAVQAVGAVPVDVQELGVDLLSLSGHKLYGPKGIGALYVRRGTRLTPVVHGGGQERGLRSGTENVPGIVGLGEAIRLAVEKMPEEAPRQAALRDRLIDGTLASVPDVVVLGGRDGRLPANACFSVRFIEGESMVLKLDALGIAASSGSACASASLEPSHVILALGHDAVTAHGSLRLTLGRENTEADVDYFLEVFPGVVEQLRAMSPLYVKG